VSHRTPFRISILLSLLLFLPGIIPETILAQNQLSDQAQISVITASPGEELYSAFGHSSIRVFDPPGGIDSVYNYGTFDFNQPGFYWNFTRGELRYFLSRWSFRYFSQVYRSENRTLYEQILNLTQDQKQEIYAALEENYRTENRYYWYNSFLNNCSTKVRDILRRALGNNLVFPDTTFIPPVTFREAIDQYLHAHPWSGFGMNLLLGSPVDRNITYDETMFLPYELKDALANATIQSDSGSQPFVNAVRSYPAPQPDTGAGFWLFQPEGVFWLLLLAVAGMTFREYRLNRYYRNMDIGLFALVGLFGLFLLFMWFGTIRVWVAANWNLVWALPTHFVAAILMSLRKQRDILSKYFYAAGMVSLLTISLWQVIPQEMSTSLLPLVLVLGIRSLSAATHHQG